MIIKKTYRVAHPFVVSFDIFHQPELVTGAIDILFLIEDIVYFIAANNRLNI